MSLQTTYMYIRQINNMIYNVTLYVIYKGIDTSNLWVFFFQIY